MWLKIPHFLFFVGTERFEAVGKKAGNIGNGTISRGREKNARSTGWLLSLPEFVLSLSSPVD